MTNEYFSRSDVSKREGARLQLDIDGLCRIGRNADFVSCKVIDISTNGMRLQVKVFVEAGDAVEVKTRLDERDLVIKGVAMHARGKEVGVRFDDVKDKDVTFIRDYVSNHFFDRVKNNLK